MFTEDLSIFYDTTVGFAKTALVSLTGGGTREVPVIFNIDRVVAVDGYGEIRPADLQFLCRAKTSDLGSVDPNNQIVIEGVTYKIQVKQPTAHGETFMMLKRVN